MSAENQTPLLPCPHGRSGGPGSCPWCLGLNNPAPHPFRSIAEGIVETARKETWVAEGKFRGDLWTYFIEKALEALAAEKNAKLKELDADRMEERRWHDRAIEAYQTEKNRFTAEIASLRSEVERLKGALKK